MKGDRASWSGQFAFVLAAAASAIGLGNLWRFPYLAAQYGGGTFILVYLCLVVTLGFTLMLTEIAIGRKTRQSQLTAYARLHSKWGFIGIISTIIPFLIVPYYCVIGGWVLKYFVTYLKMALGGVALMGEGAVDSGLFFNAFVASDFAPFCYGAVFVAVCAAVIRMGVKNGIERSNLFLMPILLVLAIVISAYVVCLPGAVNGVRYYLVPNLDCLKDIDGEFSFAALAKTVLGAMGQMFYSLSLAMGIMITYGSYMRKCDSIEKCVRRVEIFDTLVAILAGMMIVPVVYMFAIKTGTPIKEAMNAGPGLMFITLPKVFATLGSAGAWVGLAFFSLVIFAALTSAISLYEACVSSLCDFLPFARKSITLAVGVAMLALSVFPAFGYGLWAEVRIGFGDNAMPLLDFFDFIANSVLMPITAAATCVFVGWGLKLGVIIDEVEASGDRFKAKAFYASFVKYFAPTLVIAILVSEVFRTFGWLGWRI